MRCAQHGGLCPCDRVSLPGTVSASILVSAMACPSARTNARSLQSVAAFRLRLTFGSPEATPFAKNGIFLCVKCPPQGGRFIHGAEKTPHRNGAGRRWGEAICSRKTCEVDFGITVALMRVGCRPSSGTISGPATWPGAVALACVWRRWPARAHVRRVCLALRSGLARRGWVASRIRLWFARLRSFGRRCIGHGARRRGWNGRDWIGRG